MKLSRDDYSILRAALAYALEGDGDLWEELSGDELDRAAEILDDFERSAEGGEEEEDDDDDPWDADDGDEDEGILPIRKVGDEED